MSEVPKIINFGSIVEPHLSGGQVVSYSARYLTKPGDNYGSVMLAIAANVKRANGEIEELPLVAKLPPITNDMYWQIFQPERTCLTENATYKYLASALRRLELDEGIAESNVFDGFPKYYGSRISLNDKASVVDRDAVLVQENLQTSGFKAGNRHLMFDYAHTVLVLREMARYHALPIALRLKKPHEFDELVRPYFRRFDMNKSLGPEMVQQIYGEAFKEVEIATNNNGDVLKKIKQLFDNYDAYWASGDSPDTIYTTIAHNDMWINNLMLQYDENSAPAKVKFVDFQIAQYDSLAHDIVFVLFTSVDSAIVEQHLEELLRIYFDAFVASLKSVNVCTEQYTFQGLLEELKRCAPIQIPHILFMVKIILADNSTMPEDFKDMSIDVISANTGVAAITEKTAEVLRLAQKFNYF